MKKELKSAFAVLITLAVVLLSVSVAFMPCHDCMGPDCEICAAIHNVTCIIRQIAVIITLILISAGVIYALSNDRSVKIMFAIFHRIPVFSHTKITA